MYTYTHCIHTHTHQRAGAGEGPEREEGTVGEGRCPWWEEGERGGQGEELSHGDHHPSPLRPGAARRCLCHHIRRPPLLVVLEGFH